VVGVGIGAAAGLVLGSSADPCYVLGRPIMLAKAEPLPIAALTRELLHGDFDTRLALDYLTSACEGELYVCGGSVRDAILMRARKGDLDLLVPNGDARAYKALERLGVPFELNTHRHRRYRWGVLQIDVFEPGTFLRGFATVEEALAYFDLRVNALAVHLGSGRVLDPLDGVACLVADRNPGINWPRWTTTDPCDLVVLAIRLVRLLSNLPQLTVQRRDREQLLLEILPRLEEADWGPVRTRFPLGRVRFLEEFRQVLRRSQ
jgi:hypothetical protein